jgi:NAD(P)-dependent dehydrogenase (short-subunit alcohol dehydrogenase family)
MAKTRIVITGSPRGVELRMAREFLSRGCAVMVSGRTRQAVDSALAQLKSKLHDADVHGPPCDNCDDGQVEALWTAAAQTLWGVDHWIKNAGIGQPTTPIWELAPDEMEAVIRTDLLGVLYGARVAMRRMVCAGKGMIWFMEGHGFHLVAADRLETVAALLAPRILAAKKNGTHIDWLTNAKGTLRFMTAGFRKRSVMPD